MRLTYEIQDVAWVELEATPVGHRYNLVSLMVEPQYQNLGLGTALMKVVCKDADEHEVELWVVPASINLRQEDLLRFYKNLGFKYAGTGYWERLPQPAN